MTKDQLLDPLWRLQNLYSIKDAASGKIVKFVPRPEQMAVFRAIYVHKKKRIVILKARRLGMSTAIDVLAADLAIWNAGVQISIIDQTQDDASKKLANICKVAFSGLPEAIRKRFEVLRDNDGAWQIGLKGDASSAIYAGKNARGGTNQLLHVSEWGPIQADDPRRSEEILTGALPSAEHGIVIIETTWKGGKGGLLWSQIVKPALEQAEAEKTERDWIVFFFPWWKDPTYSESGDVATIDPEVAVYLRELEERIGQTLTDGQKVWYARRRKELGMFIWREFPSTLDECFRAPIDGAIYADIVDKLRSQGAIQPFKVDGAALVHTFWDLGSPLNTVTWYVQLVGREIRVIDCDMNLDLTPIQRVAHIMAKGYPLGFHYLPHDAQATDKSGKTFATELTGAGLANIRTIPRTIDIWIGINRLRELMPRMLFRLPACEAGVAALENYHTRRESSGGIAQDFPVHDWSSHPSDALRMFAEAEAAGMLTGDSSTAKKAKRRMGSPVIMGLSTDGPRSRGDRLDDL